MIEIQNSFDIII